MTRKNAFLIKQQRNNVLKKVHIQSGIILPKTQWLTFQLNRCSFIKEIESLFDCPKGILSLHPRTIAVSLCLSLMHLFLGDRKKMLAFVMLHSF